MLVKANLDERQIEKMEELKLYVGENTASKAAVFAIENYCGLEQQYSELALEFFQLRQKLELIQQYYKEKHSADYQLNRLIMKD